MKIPGDKCVGELKEMMPRNVSCDATVNNDEWNLHVVNDTYSARVGQSIMLEVQVGLQVNILTLYKEYYNLSNKSYITNIISLNNLLNILS